MTDKEVLLEWAKTHGDDSDDVRAAMYSPELMIEFAKYFQENQNMEYDKELLVDFIDRNGMLTNSGIPIEYIIDWYLEKPINFRQRLNSPAKK